ncbi:MAG: hypothetical protein M1826_002001 [Phylliscum demangeonii]|nr:MAG: hypothetical protein M1826_002001 [Phylliscum demangeonii]
MRAVIVLLLACASLAQPTLNTRDDYDFTLGNPSGWPAPLRRFFEAVGLEVVKARNAPDFPRPPQCDLSLATMPTAPTPLPGPGDGLTLVHVAVGRGTQNYTCADDTKNSKPAAIGALANLYNTSCTAALYPDVLALLPAAVLALPLPSHGDDGHGPFAPASFDLSGHHYFADATTPTFDMGTKQTYYGLIHCAKQANSSAPPDAPKGANGYGSVPWLKLSDKGASTGFKEVYRLNTAGGVAPPTCEGMSAHFEIEYAAEYWFWG